MKIVQLLTKEKVCHPKLTNNVEPGKGGVKEIVEHGGGFLVSYDGPRAFSFIPESNVAEVKFYERLDECLTEFAKAAHEERTPEPGPGPGPHDVGEPCKPKKKTGRPRKK